MMRKVFFVIFQFVFFISFSQIPAGYYNSAAGLNGEPLKIALHNIIDNHTTVDYSAIHAHYESTDKKPNGKVWDIYSSVASGTPPYEYSFILADQCGNYSQEGDCYNREHSWPKSWYGGEVMPMYTDLFLVYPSDGFVNGKRSNYPYGEVNSANWTSYNGSKLGNCVTPGYTQTVFEPIDLFKGDLARSYFYMSVRYYNEDSGWPGSDMVDGAELKPWALSLMLNWHYNDPVSQKEIDRNNAIYIIQNNRNPFIDHPEWVDSVWNPTFSMEIIPKNYRIKIYPNPTRGKIIIETKGVLEIEIINLMGTSIQKFKNTSEIDISKHAKGIYFIKITNKKSTVVEKIILE